LTESALL
jgi:hypothetical protein